MIKIGLKQEMLPQLNFSIKFFGRWLFFLYCDLLTLKAGICPCSKTGCISGFSDYFLRGSFLGITCLTEISTSSKAVKSQLFLLLPPTVLKTNQVWRALGIGSILSVKILKRHFYFSLSSCVFQVSPGECLKELLPALNVWGSNFFSSPSHFPPVTT